MKKKMIKYVGLNDNVSDTIWLDSANGGSTIRIKFTPCKTDFIHINIDKTKT